MVSTRAFLAIVATLIVSLAQACPAYFANVMSRIRSETRNLGMAGTKRLSQENLAIHSMSAAHNTLIHHWTARGAGLAQGESKTPEIPSWACGLYDGRLRIYCLHSARSN